MSAKQTGPASWEVGPQVEVIAWFEDCPLTNFYVGKPLVIESGLPYPGWYMTAEHAFQAQKALSSDMAAYIARSGSPSEAKSRGRHIKLRKDWNDIKDEVMRRILRAKFAPGRAEHDYLLSTGDLPLIEGNTWNDTYWGAEKHPHGGWVGMNRLGQLLMELRAELRETL